jgi:hypothetical protein
MKGGSLAPVIKTQTTGVKNLQVDHTTTMLHGRKNRQGMIFHGGRQVMKDRGTGDDGGGTRQENGGKRNRVMTK